MPEGPEIRRAADQVEKAIAGSPLQSVWFAFPRLKKFERTLQRQTVTAVQTRGKAMLTCFDGGLVLYSHNQLYGKWYVSRPGNMPSTGRSLRVALHGRKNSALLYSASEIDVLTVSSLDEHPFLSRLGPDILDSSLDEKAVAERLTSDRFRRRSLGALYLDQHFLAGLGNYLRTEILFRAGLDARLSPAQLDTNRVARLSRETLAISKRAYVQKGITVDRTTFRALKASGQDYAQYRFWVFARQGMPCRLCGEAVVKTTHSGRNWFYCPSCQGM